jgi:hypothetical protein
LGVEEAIQTAKGDAGLDQYEVRRYDAWYRQVTLSLLAAAFLAVLRTTVTQERGVVVTTLGVLVWLSARELRRLLARLVWPPPSDPARTLAWSLWVAPPTPGLRSPCAPAAPPTTRPPYLTHNEVRL